MANDAIVASRTSEPLPLLRWQSKAVQPAWVRIAHWTNAIAVLILVGSGWRIYNASPIFGFRFPKELVLGGWLGGALLWHFAAMWLLVGNAAVYLLLTVVSGRLQQRFFPLTPRQILADLGAALRGRLDHSNFSQYNALQKCAYLGVWVLLLIVVVSGLAVWKSVQLPLLRELMGGFDNARIVHFFAMCGLVVFIAVHVLMVALVPKTLRLMVVGR